MFNIAHCLPTILDVNSWYILLRTMQSIETFIVAAHTGQQPQLAGKGGAPGLVDFAAVKKRAQASVVEFNIRESFRKRTESECSHEEEASIGVFEIYSPPPQMTAKTKEDHDEEEEKTRPPSLSGMHHSSEDHRASIAS